MRIEIKLKPENKNLIVPFNYNDEIHNQLLEKIFLAAPDLAKILQTEYKDYFTFSRIMIREREIIPEEGIKVLSDDVSLYISSSLNEVIKSIAEGFVSSPILKIGKATFSMVKIEILREPTISDGTLFSTLSPIVVRTAKFEDNKVKIWDLYPNNEGFQDKLRKIMLTKFSEIYGKLPEDTDFHIDVIKFKPVRIKVAKTYYRGSLMVFRYYGSKEIGKFGYENGFGDKTSYGFGMVKVIDEEEQ